MHRKLHHILSTLTLAAIVGVCAAPADAHFSVHRGGKLFYFDGHAYNDQGTSKIGDSCGPARSSGARRAMYSSSEKFVHDAVELRNINGAFAQGSLLRRGAVSA